MRTIVWAGALFIAACLWGWLTTAIAFPGRVPFKHAAWVAIDNGLPLFVVTGVIGVIVFLLERFPSARRHLPMWTWTATLLVAMVVLGLGSLSGRTGFH